MSHIARELKMLFYLNDHMNRLVKISELSDLLEVTPRQVRRYRDDLEQCEFYISEVRGPNGGYKLVKKASEYKVGDILRAAEGSLAPVSCLSNPTNECPRKSSCATVDFWTGLNNTINNYVDSYTLEDLVNKYVTEGGEYYI